MAETAAIAYRAFLSYSHRDTAWAKWLHAALESYRVDADLVGTDTPIGPVPKTLRPIFRDREDFSAGHSLAEQTVRALDASRFLIVLCSPHAARSNYVNEEIRRYKAMGRPDRLLPLIIAGAPGDPERECFPPALRFKLDPHGALSTELEEPVAADARPEGDGKEIAKLKLISGLLGVGFDQVVRRAERARRRRLRNLSLIAGSILFLGVASTSTAALSVHLFKTNSSMHDFALDRTTGFINRAVAVSEKFNVPRAISVGFLEEAEGLLEGMISIGRETPQLRYRKAQVAIAFARNFEILGRSDKQKERAKYAVQLLNSLSAAQPDDLTYQKELSAAYIELGNVEFTHGSVKSALDSYRSGLVVAGRLLNANPDNVVWQRGIALIYEKVGDILAAQGDNGEALKFFRAGLVIDQQLAAINPTDTRGQRDLSVSYNKIGEILLAEGDRPGALAFFRDALAIRQRLAAADPTHKGWQRDLAVSQVKVGEVLFRQGDIADALVFFRESLAIREHLVRDDPTNLVWQRDLTVAYNKLGDAYVAQRDWPRANKSFLESLAVSERLAAADPGNTDWQRDLMLSLNRLGDLALEVGDRDKALSSFRISLVISERLAKSDLENAGWQRDYAISLRKVAVLLIRQGDFSEAQRLLDESAAADARWSRRTVPPQTAR